MYIHSRICLPRWLPKLKLTWRALYWISVIELYCKWSFIQLCCLSYVWFVLFYHIGMTSYKMNSSNGWLFVIRRGTNTIRSFADFSNIMYHRYNSLGYYIFERKRCKKNRFICLIFNIRNKTLGGIFLPQYGCFKASYIYVFWHFYIVFLEIGFPNIHWRRVLNISQYIHFVPWTVKFNCLDSTDSLIWIFFVHLYRKLTKLTYWSQNITKQHSNFIVLKQW